MQQTINQPTTNAPKPPSSRRSLRQVLSTRRGMLGLAAVVAMLGAGAILVFLQQYRDSVNDETRPVTVLVAKGLIGKGTAGDVVATDVLFQASEIPESEAKDGALTDPGSLRGRIATKDVFPGEQITTGSFAVGTGSVKSKLTDKDRAIAVPVDAARGLGGNVRPGDRVDVLAALVVQSSAGQPRPIVRPLVQDALVLDAPSKTEAGARSSDREEVTLRVSDRQALAVAFAAENGKVYLVLRPPSHAGQSPPSLGATAESLVAGLRPLTLESRGRNRR